MKEAFITKNFRERSLALITIANSIIDDYQSQGFKLTLRQLYYQFVARDYIENTKQSYDNLGAVINNGRLAGLIDWNAIEDRTRNLVKQWHFDSPKDAIEQVRRQYVIDMWDNQRCRIEVWIEKEALVGVIAATCIKYDVPYFACRGYVSQSELYEAGSRAAIANDHWGQNTIIIHLGDHDPSGIDMTRDNLERLDMFAGTGVVTVERIALNMDQVRQYSPPPNPAKLTDSRCRQYIKTYGNKSWELDALDPSVINELILDQIEGHIDWNAWHEMEDRQTAECRTLDKIIDNLQ